MNDLLTPEQEEVMNGKSKTCLKRIVLEFKMGKVTIPSLSDMKKFEQPDMDGGNCLGY